MDIFLHGIGINKFVVLSGDGSDTFDHALATAEIIKYLPIPILICEAEFSSFIYQS